MMSDNYSVCVPFNNFHINAPFSGEITINEDKVKNIDIDFLLPEIYKEGMWINSSYVEILSNFQKLSSLNSIINTETFCRAIEEIANIEVTSATQKLRIVFNEIGRINSHLLVLGDMADIMYMDILCGEIMRQKDKISKLFYEMFGSRIFASFNTVGGTLKITRQMILKIKIIIKSIDDYFKGISELFHEDSAVKEALTGVGVLKDYKARILGVTGPIAKASGIDKDLRSELYGVYAKEFRPIVFTAGDCYARALVRVDEIIQSISLIYEMLENITLENITLGEAENTLPASSIGETLLRYEQSEGVSEIHVKLGGNGIIKKFILCTFRGNTVKAMKSALIDADLLDVPIIMSSFNYCDCGMEVK